MRHFCNRICTIFVAIVPLIAIFFLSMDTREPSALETIHGRTSIRSYTSQPVSQQQVEELLRAAMAAPSSRNIQPWRFYVVRDRGLLESLAEQLPFAKMTANAPLAIVVCGDITAGSPNQEQQLNWVLDCSAATQNLLLAAHAMGLGAVWTGVYPYKDRVDAVRNILELPEHIKPLNVIPLGYPAESPEPKQKWDPGKVTYR